ncbi:MAG: hypothetical protein ACLP50_16030 [Solirubrobacteraceae bacterium]
MFEDDRSEERWEDTLRSMAREAGRSLERAIDQFNVDEVADTIGVDPTVAREWVESAGSWLRAQAESLGDEVASQVAGAGRPAAADTWLGATPHPLDLPTEEQGLALAALASGRWTVEPGTGALAAKGDGPAPTDALGIVRELRVRDWIAADGEITIVGRHALSRWLDATTPR